MTAHRTFWVNARRLTLVVVASMAATLSSSAAWAIPACDAANFTTPCTIGGTLVVDNVSGNLFSGGGGGGGATVTFIDDPLNPGFTITANAPITLTGPGQLTFTGFFSLATVGGLPATINGVSASITGGVTGAALLTETIGTPSGPLVLTVPGAVPDTVTGQRGFPGVIAFQESITIAATAATGESATVSSFTYQARLAPFPGSLLSFVRFTVNNSTLCSSSGPSAACDGVFDVPDANSHSTRFVISATGNPDFTALRSFSSFSVSNASELLVPYSLQITSAASDTLTITDPGGYTGPANVELTYHTTGSVSITGSCPAGAVSATAASGIPGCNFADFIVQNGLNVNGEQVQSTTYDSPTDALLDQLSIFGLTAQFTGGVSTVEFDQMFQVVDRVLEVDHDMKMDVISDLRGTIALTNIKVTDPSGNPIPRLTIGSVSGTEYSLDATNADPIALLESLRNLVSLQVPGSALKSRGMRAALLSRLDDIGLAIDAGQTGDAIDQLTNLRRRLDGCGSSPDRNDWVIDCPNQLELRQRVDFLLQVLGT